MCPIKDDKPANIREKVELSKIIIGIIPFDASRNNVKIASLFDPDLKTFVAPIFLEPSFVISILLKYFVKTYPLGIEPKR